MPGYHLAKLPASRDVLLARYQTLLWCVGQIEGAAGKLDERTRWRDRSAMAAIATSFREAVAEARKLVEDHAQAQTQTAKAA